jgi:hypothetical protein
MRYAGHKPGPWIAALAVALAACGGENVPEPGPAAAEPLLVIEDRGPVVVSGRDTTMVLAPTMFAWFDVDPADAPKTAADADALRRFQQSLLAAQPRLQALGVRVVPQDTPPVVVELPPGAPAPETLRGAPGAFGYLFIDIAGRMARRDGIVEAGALVCLATVTFGLSGGVC